MTKPKPKPKPEPKLINWDIERNRSPQRPINKPKPKN
jgi:hypothetical protein